MGPETSLRRAPERAHLPLWQGGSHRRPGERRPRRKVECRPRVELARALRLGHRVVQRDPESVLSPEQKLRWRGFRKRCREQEKELTASWRGKLTELGTLASEVAALGEKLERTRSEKLAEKFIAAGRRLIALAREKDAVELRLKVALETGNRFDRWLQPRRLRDRPEDRRDLADNDPEELYDRLYQETLLAQPVSGSLGELSEELRGHYRHLEKIEPGAPDFPQVGAYQKRIDQLTAELRRRGVTADDDTLYELVTRSTRYRDEKLFNDARIRRTPPGTLSFGERVFFRVEPFYLPPGSTLEVEWRWRPLGGRKTPFAGKPMGKTRELTLALDESFWGWVPGPVREQKGVQVVADLYLDGSFTRRLDSEWVPFQEGLRAGLLESVRVVAQPRRAIPEAPVACRLTSWTPPGLRYQVEWLVNGEVVSRGPRRSYEPRFATPGSYRVAARIYHLEKGDLVPIHTTPETAIEVSAAPDLGRETLDLFEQRGLPGLSTVRPGLEKTITALEKKAALGGGDQDYWQQRLEAQRKRLAFLDREVPDASSVLELGRIETPAVGSRYSAPVPATLLHPEISGPVPLSLFLVLHYRQTDRWEAKLLDLTSGDSLSYPGSGASRQDAASEAVRYWQAKNPYPKGGTVSFRCPGWTGKDHFSTTNLEKTVKEWVDKVLLVGGVVLLLSPEFTGSKALGISLILASLARAGYAIYENLTLGVPWYDTRNVLEALSIVGSVAGLSGGVLRAAGVQAARTGVYRTGTALVLFGLGTDITSAVVVTYQGLAMIRAIQDDPTLDDAQKASQLVRISAMLLLNGAMTIASNRDLFTSRRGSLAGRALDPDATGSLGPRTRRAMEVEVKRRGQGKQLVATDGSPISDRRLFELFCEVQASEQRLTDVQAELGSDRARREFGRLIRSKRRLQPIDAAARVRLSRALEVPVHLDPELPAGSVRVHYRVDGGEVRKIEVRTGAGTSLDDVLRHAPTLQLLKRYRGLTGKLRSRLDRLRAFFGRAVPTPADGLAFEAWGELLKLPGLIAKRRRRLVGRDLDPGDRARIEAELESLRLQLETNLPLVEKLARRRGYVAAEISPDLPSHLQTVEQRWRIGDPIPEQVLADPDRYLYDTTTRGWRRLTEPYLGTTKIRTSHAPEKFYQFSWEQEGTSDAIYLFYRPQNVSDEVWLKPALREGKTLADLEACVRACHSPEQLDRVVDTAVLAQQAKGTNLTELVKTSLAHPKMAPELKVGGVGEWETTHRGYERDPNRVLGKDGQIQWVAQRLGNRGFHLHVSFPRPTRAEEVDRLLTLVAHLNNYEALRSYRRGAHIGKTTLGVMGTEQLDRIRQLLTGDPSSLSLLDALFKWHFVALRRSPYKETGDRIGIEFRVYHGAEGETPTVELIRKALGVLGQPERGFSLHGGRKYTLAELRSTGLVPGKPVLQKALPEELFRYLERAAGVARDLPGSTTQSKPDQLLTRWSVPFLDWKRHPAVPESAHGVIDAAHHELLRKLRTFSGSEPTADSQHQIQQAIAEWANATNLWKEF